MGGCGVARVWFQCFGKGYLKNAQETPNPTLPMKHNLSLKKQALIFLFFLVDHIFPRKNEHEIFPDSVLHPKQ